MPRNPDRRARIPSIAGKIQAIKGFNAEEKALFVRVASLIESLVVTQRNMANPLEQMNKKLREDVPIPINLIPTELLQGVEVTWDPVNFNNFLYYDVQFDVTNTFSNPFTRTVGTNSVTIKDNNNTDLFVRVRTVSRKGGASEFSDTLVVPLIIDIYDLDQDSSSPENRTTVIPRPELFGDVLSVSGGNKAFVGHGANVGPGPIKFFDFSFSTGEPVEINQVTYILEENNVKSQSNTMGLPTFFNEEDSTRFYPFFPGFSLDSPADEEYTSFPGAYVDFFYTHEYVSAQAALDVQYQTYLKSTGNHEQTGTIMTNTNFIIKH